MLRDMYCNIMEIMSSHYQPHVFKPLTMLRAGGDDINACGVNAAVTEDVGELGNIFFHAVKRARKQMPQVVRKHFAWIDICILAELFHFTQVLVCLA